MPVHGHPRAAVLGPSFTTGRAAPIRRPRNRHPVTFSPLPARQLHAAPPPAAAPHTERPRGIALQRDRPYNNTWQVECPTTSKEIPRELRKANFNLERVALLKVIVATPGWRGRPARPRNGSLPSAARIGMAAASRPQPRVERQERQIRIGYS